MDPERIIKQNNIHIVHSQGARADFLARFAGHFGKVPAIVSTIQMPVEGFDVSTLRKLIYKFFDRFSEKYVDWFIVVSDRLRKILIYEHGVSSQKVIKIW